MTSGGALSGDRQRVLDATDIVRLVGESVALKPKGREFVCLCPFHDDHKPSMYVVPHKQIYHCFSCGAGGNALDFVINFHKLEFIEALKLLAERAGIELTPPARRANAPEGEAPSTSRADLAQANQFAFDFFRALLRHPQHGSHARAMVEKRLLTPETVEAFGIGCAPDRWDGLFKTIESRRLDPALFVEAGLLKQREAGQGHYDVFRNRLVFPICDQLGRPIAFGGRRLNDDEEPKYLNSPETRLFDKGGTLFALHRAQKSIQQRRQAIICEGYVDAIACHQHGFTNAVATLGTALTPRHAATLKRLCDSIVLLFDADEAGMRAADRALEVFFAEPVDVKIAVLPDGLDADELLAQEGGRERFALTIESATDALEYRFARLRERLRGAGEAARVRAVEEDMARLVELGLHDLTLIRRQLVVRRVAALLGVDEAVVIAAIPARRGGAKSAPRLAESQTNTRTTGEHALGCLLTRPDLAEWLSADELVALSPGESGAYPAGPATEVARAVWRAAVEAKGGDPPTLQAILLDIEDVNARMHATALAMEADRRSESVEHRLLTELRECARTIAARRAQERRSLDSTSVKAEDQLQRVVEERRAHGASRSVMPRPGVQSAARKPVG